MITMVNLSKYNEYGEESNQWRTEWVKSNCRRDIRERNDLGALFQLMQLGGIAR